MHEELLEALKAADKDAAMHCIVITGAGRGFCWGQDLEDRVVESGKPAERPASGESLRKRYNPIIRKLRQIEKPIVAAIDEMAAGAEVAGMASDLRIASDAANLIWPSCGWASVPIRAPRFCPGWWGGVRPSSGRCSATRWTRPRPWRPALCQRRAGGGIRGRRRRNGAHRLAAGPTRAWIDEAGLPAIGRGGGTGRTAQIWSKLPGIGRPNGRLSRGRASVHRQAAGRVREGLIGGVQG